MWEQLFFPGGQRGAQYTKLLMPAKPIPAKSVRSALHFRYSKGPSHHQSPNTFHQTKPITVQIEIFTADAINPNRHQSRWPTYPAPK